jgi:hypothetical protein
MIDYDTNSRIQAARDRADRLADEILRTRPLERDEAANPGWAKIGSAFAAHVGRLHRRKHAPAYQA